MRTDRHGASTCPLGQEQYEEFRWSWQRDDEPARVQYDYRRLDGKLFSCIAPTLEDARARRDQWESELARLRVSR